MRNLLLRAFILALAGCLFGMGIILLPQFTLSSQALAPTIDKPHECLYMSENWDCKKLSPASELMDPGAIAWVDIPSSFFAHDFSFLSKWNPFIGSGYPEFLNGHFRSSSWSRWILGTFPGDDSRDFVIFLRFLLWTFSITLLVAMMGGGLKSQFFSALLAQLIPYAAFYLDHVFLDVDMLAPFLLIWLVLSIRLKDEKGRIRNIYWIGTLLYGIWIGLQTFLQAQIIFLFIAGIMTLICYPRARTNLLISSFLLVSGCVVAMSPEILKFLQYFPELISSRLPNTCYISAPIPTQSSDWLWRGFTKNQSQPFMLISAGSIPLLLMSLKNREWRPIAVGGIVLASFCLFGLPPIFCQIKGLNGVYYFRHSLPYIQSLFFISMFVGFNELRSFFSTSKKMKGLAIFLIVIGIVTFVPKGFVFEKAIKTNNLLQIQRSSSPPGNHFVSKLIELSQSENRRHFSPDQSLYPNWSSVFHIYDARVLEALYPKYTYELMSQILSGWTGDSFDPLKPDRFITSKLEWGDQWERFFILFRISILSYKSNVNFLPVYGIISKATCESISKEHEMTIFYCRNLGSIDFFPSKVITAPSSEVISKINSLAPKDLKDLAILTEEESAGHPEVLTAAQGSIDRINKLADLYEYEISVSKPGLFVMADTYFKGWKAFVNGHETPIYRVNHAFKGVHLPFGEVQLKLIFDP